MQILFLPPSTVHILPPPVHTHTPQEVVGLGPDIAVVIPPDPRQRFVIDAVAFYVMRDGCEFEQVGAWVCLVVVMVVCVWGGGGGHGTILARGAWRLRLRLAAAPAAPMPARPPLPAISPPTHMCAPS